MRAKPLHFVPFPGMNSFFPMRRPERIALFVLILFSTIAFLPFFGEISVLGVAVFGWLMAILLLGSPAILLLLLFTEPETGSAPESKKPAEPASGP